MEKLAKELDESIEFLENATQNLQNGQAADMDNFNERIKDICQTMNSLSENEAEAYLDKMEKLQDALHVFELDLRQKKADIEIEIKKLNKKQSAANAYERAKGTE